MPSLLLASFIWAFSFPLIGHFITLEMDSFFAAFAKVFLSLLVFIPFLNFKIDTNLKLKLIAIGALQLGVMNLFYYHSFLYLSVSEVALFTIFTPFYVVLFYGLFSKNIRYWYFISIFVCVLGAFIVKFDNINSNFLYGFLLIQGANLVFGAGQSFYKILLENHTHLSQKEAFAYFYLGAICITLPAFLIFGDYNNLPSNLGSWVALIYLGTIASGLGYFLWNKGSTEVDSGVLALMNNAIIPISIFINMSIFGVDVEILPFCIGSLIILLSFFVHKKIMHYYDKKSYSNTNH
ncbi:EamA family transporter [Campylobacter sp. 2014D-0216]|uniref:EamA family transporter n=1 Tax=Campylobacter sp. 2014D-0216 TaxID=1813595 RepID=UPI0018A592C9|nr:EamA family transporter [Campylobacter sp. 2014D-0216]QOR00636.1 EamA family transporter [Campylobacter sp. 2014D-0216]